MHVCMYICVCVYVCMYVYMCVCMYVCMYVYMYICVYVCLCVCVCVVVVSGRPLVHSLLYYETLNYDPSWLADQHVRVSRAARATVSSMFQSGHVHFSLSAFNRY